jgi:lipoprotein NlpD
VRRELKTLALCPTVALLLIACTSNRPAPVVERTAPSRQASAPVAAPSAARPSPRTSETRPESYTVKAGDTLYSIALEHGLDYRELAIWNGLDNPGALRIGMQLRLSGPGGAPAVPSGTAVAAPLKTPGAVEARPLGSGPSAAPAPPPAPSASGSGAMVTEPKAVRVPYSDQALAQLAKPQSAAPAKPQPAAPARADSAPVRAEPPRTETKAEARSESGSESARGPEDVEWAWPVKGKVVAGFNDASNKGITIAGKLGQPVLASAPGRVIFSGTGIRGFGKLVVIKHNNTYLSVYAHNSELNVKEGQSVAKGQKIAEMGDTDADQVKLHFEIRRFGKPVDPLKLLPAA